MPRPPPLAEPSGRRRSTASRWTQGNFLFPTRIVVSPQRVSRIKSRLFGSNEESIADVESRVGAHFDRRSVVRDS